MTVNSDHRFSVTVHSDDLAVIGCLRALAKFAHATGNNNIPWGNTKDSHWKAAGNRVTFHFTSPVYRKNFADHAGRLLLQDSWALETQSDNDPARPARR
jgi:hypothetical protein